MKIFFPGVNFGICGKVWGKFNLLCRTQICRYSVLYFGNRRKESHLPASKNDFLMALLIIIKNSYRPALKKSPLEKKSKPRKLY